MRDHTSVYVAPQYDDERQLVGWRYEVVRNGRLAHHAENFDTPEQARLAGQTKALEG